MPNGAPPVLEVLGLRTVFRTRGGEIHAVNDVSFEVRPGELLGVVGESGSGKSVTMMSLLSLLPSPPAENRGGRVMFGGENLLDTMILYASSDSSNYNHSIARQPIILAGHGRGHLVHPGIHYQTEPWNGSNGSMINSSGNTSDVLLSCLRAFDPNASSVGGGPPMSTTPLTEIMA